MRKKEKSISSKVGMPPGSMIYIGKEKNHPVKVTEVNFSPDEYKESGLSEFEKSKSGKKEKNLTTWINIDGAHDIEIIESLGQYFNIDHLVLEDIVNTNLRPKFEDLGNFLFFSMKTLRLNKMGEIEKEQLSLLLGATCLITIDDGDTDSIAKYKERIKLARGLSRQRKEDFVFYRIIDIMVDNYFHITEHLSDAMEELEDKIIQNPEENLAGEIYYLKRKIGSVKKVIVPLKEAISGIIRTESELISENTHKYLRDVYEHAVQLSEILDNQKDNVGDFLNLYMSGVSNKMNEVMKVLTIFASIFIPLTFIAGVYGMNFELIPELKWEYGYFITWGIMLAVAISLLAYFRRKKWL